MQIQPSVQPWRVKDPRLTLVAFPFPIEHSIKLEEHTLSAPSRRPEIRRRRTRKDKITKLRKRLAASGAESDRSKITAKLQRLGRNSPGQPLVKS